MIEKPRSRAATAAETFGLAETERVQEGIGAKRINQILALVDRIHQRMDFRCPPLRFEDFLAHFDSYSVFETDLPQGTDGRVSMAADGQKRIYLRRDNPRPLLRLALAHEIIHAELHLAAGRTVEIDGCRVGEHRPDGSLEVAEREAEFGAAALLMPLWMVSRYVPRVGVASERGVRDLARMFRVTDAVVRTQLTYWDAIGEPLSPGEGPWSHSSWMESTSVCGRLDRLTAGRAPAVRAR